MGRLSFYITMNLCSGWLACMYPVKQGVNITLKGNALSGFPLVITLANCQGDAPGPLTFQLAELGPRL